MSWTRTCDKLPIQLNNEKKLNELSKLRNSSREKLTMLNFLRKRLKELKGPHTYRDINMQLEMSAEKAVERKENSIQGV